MLADCVTLKCDPPGLRVLAVVLLRCCRAAGWIQISSSRPRGARKAGVYMSLSYCPSRHPDSLPSPKIIPAACKDALTGWGQGIDTKLDVSRLCSHPTDSKFNLLELCLR